MKNKVVILSYLILHFSLMLSAMEPGGKYVPPRLRNKAGTSVKSAPQNTNPCSCSKHVNEPRVEPLFLVIKEKYFKEEKQIVQIAKEVHEIAYADEIAEIKEQIDLESPLIDRRMVIAWLLSSPEKEQSLKNQFKSYLSNLAKFHIANTNNLDEVILLALAFDDLAYWECDLYSEIISKVSNKKLTPQQLSQIAFALRKIKSLKRCSLPDQRVINFYRELNTKAISMLKNNDFNYVEIGLTLKAFTQHDILQKNYDLFDLAQKKIVELFSNQENIKQVDAEAIKNIIWSFAYPKNGVNSGKIKTFKGNRLIYIDTSKIQQCIKLLITKKIANFTPKQLSMVACSFGYLGETSFSSIYNVYDKFVSDIENYQPKEIVTIIKFLHEDSTVKQSYFISLVDKIKHFKYEPSDLVRLTGSLLFGYCLAQNQEKEQFEKLIHEFLSKIIEFSPEIWEPSELSEINTIYRLYALKSGATFLLPDKLFNRIKEYLAGQEKPLSSNFHDEVAKHLNRLKPGLVNEYPFESYFLDIAYIKEKLAIEVDGPSHFNFTGENPSFRNKNKIKETILKLENWRLVRIPFFEWPNTNEAQIKYLRAKLEAVNIDMS